jgi:hypothetical protein
MTSARPQNPDTSRDVFVRRSPPGWPSTNKSKWFVWCQGEHLYALDNRDHAVAKARLEAASRGVAAWLGEPRTDATPI